MDCYSVESEFIESLDFLSPPVKRIHDSREDLPKSIYQHEPSNVHLLRGLRNKFARRAPSVIPNKHTRSVKTNAESSTSLVLKKTSERQILQQYSILSYTSLQNEELHAPGRAPKLQQNLEKPVIQVTVIPKSDQQQTAKILRKRRLEPKTLQNTTSNHENSVQTKNVYLIVAGRRREKIYEIKTTGSAQFSTDHDDTYSRDDELPVKEITNFKHLMKSLSMDKKKKKGKALPSQTARAPTVVEWKSGFPCCTDCVGRKEEPTQVPMRSRVRIFGQFGISEDDQYVLRYGASVNDKEVLSDVAKLTRDFSPVVNDSALNCDLSCDEDAVEKDVVAQLQDDITKFEVRAVTEDTDNDDSDIPSKGSQATQVNFNIQVSSKQLSHLDKKVQCGCQTDSTHKLLKDCQSPLVIISVYPKQSTDDSQITASSEPDRFQRPPLMNAYTSNPVVKTDKATKKSDIDTRGSFKRRARSPVPSPIKKSSRTKMQGNASGSRQSSPDRQKAHRAVKDKIKEKDKFKQKKANKIMATSVINTQDVTTQVHPTNKKQQLFRASNISKVNQKPTARERMNYNVSTSSHFSKPIQKQVNQNTLKNNNMPQNALQQQRPEATDKICSINFLGSRTQNQRQPSPNTGTQMSYNKTSNGTQISVGKNQQSFIASRLSKKDTYIVSNTTNNDPKADKTRKNIKLREKGINTEHALAKKALIDSYTKKLTERMNERDISSPRYAGSKVTININGDKEDYDLLFNQDKLSTDITVRKRVKDMGAQVDYDNVPVPEYSPRVEIRRRDKSLPPKAVSVTIGNKQSDDGSSPLPNYTSRLSIRDSLEISHRREDRGAHSNMKNTQTCYTAQFAEDIPDETEFLAPIKHFTGDDCSICDPVERDRQIRELLGVNKLIHSNSQHMNNSSMAHCLKSNELQIDPYQYVYRQQCEKEHVAEFNFQINKICPFKHNPTSILKPTSNEGKSVAVQCHRTSLSTRYNANRYLYDESGTRFGYMDTSPLQCLDEQSPIYISQPSPFQFSNELSYNSEHIGNLPREGEVCQDYNLGTTRKRNESALRKGLEEPKKYPETKGKAAIYQQLILNRNIQVFLQVDQFSKQKPIILSRKQYNKVKRTIQKTICKKRSSHEKRKRALGIDTRNGVADELSSGEGHKKPRNNFSSGDEKRYNLKNEPSSGDEQKHKYKNELFSSDEKKFKYKNELSSGDEKNKSSSEGQKCQCTDLSFGNENKYKLKNELPSGDERKHKSEISSNKYKKYECKNAMSSSSEDENQIKISCEDMRKHSDNEEISISSLTKRKYDKFPPMKVLKKKKKGKKAKESTSSEVTVEEIRKKIKGDQNEKGAQINIKCTKENCIHDKFKDIDFNRETDDMINTAKKAKAEIKKQKALLKSNKRIKQIPATCSEEERPRKSFSRKGKNDSNASWHDDYEKCVERDTSSQFGEQLRDRMVERQKQRNTECSVDLRRDNVRERNTQNNSELNADLYPHRHSGKLRENIPEKLYGPGHQMGTDHYSEQKRQQSFEPQFERRRDPSPDNRRDHNPAYRRNRGPEYRRDGSPEHRRDKSADYDGDKSFEYRKQVTPDYGGNRTHEFREDRTPQIRADESLEYCGDRHAEHRNDKGPEYRSEQSSDRRRARSPERSRERKAEHSRERARRSPVRQGEISFDREKRHNSPIWHRDRTPERRRDLNAERQRDRSPSRSRERSREQSCERYKRTQRDQIRHLYIDENRKDRSHDYDLCSDENNSIFSELRDIPNARLVEVSDNIGGVMETGEVEVKTLVLFNAGHSKDSKNEEIAKDSQTRKTVSSVEIRYASVAYMKQLAYSSTDVGAVSDSSLGHVTSFHTIFRGHRKSPTPNLGTSAYSLYSEDGFNSDKSAKFKEPQENKPKKPFLRRLMSCLVMRSRESELKMPVGTIPDPTSVDSSVDSYHISTSLCAVEVSSSIYDTSASFYSNHTILPVNSKIKRGFFSSVRGFLTNRKS